MKTNDRRAPRGPRPLPSIDVEKLRVALRGPGQDTRTWFENGTVGSYDPNTGAFVTTGNDECVFASTLGLVAAVRLEPLGEVVAARVGSLGAGRAGVVLFPIRPGDEVLVAIPGGALASAGLAIVGMLSNATARIPDDWNNDRLLFELNVPLQVRAPAINLDSPNLVLNGRGVARAGEGL